MVDIIPQLGSNQQQGAAAEGQARPSLDQPWVASTPTPEEASATDDRAAGNQEIANAPSYADLNQPQTPAETIPVTSGEAPVEPLTVTSGSAPAEPQAEFPATPLAPSPVEIQTAPEKTEAEKQIEELITKMEKTRDDLDEEIQELMKLQDSNHITQ